MRIKLGVNWRMKAAKMHGQALFDSPTPLSFLGRKFRLSGVTTIDTISYENIPDDISVGSFGMCEAK